MVKREMLMLDVVLLLLSVLDMHLVVEEEKEGMNGIL